MKTTNLENKVLKGSIIFLMITAVFMTTVLFTSCSETTDEALTLDDTNLIDAIETAANRSVVDIQSLPATAQDQLTEDFSDDEVYQVVSAPEIGFQVNLIGTDGSYTSEFNRAFFDTAGRGVEDRRIPRFGKRRSCFHIVFPFTVTMPDATEITLEEKSDKSLIREWYVANPDATEKPSLVFPIEIIYQDGTSETINDEDELIAAREGCVKVRCFDLVYPYSLTMPDDSIITLNSEDDRTLIKEWYRNNPGTRQRPELIFPVDIVFQDGTVQTVNDEDELKAAKESCE